MRPAGSRPRLRHLIWLAAVLVVLPVGAVVAFGMNLAQTLLLDAIAAGVVGLIALRPRVSEQVWWPQDVSLDESRGARREVARLSWAVSDRADRPVGRLMLLRLQRIADRRLERLGLHIDDPADRDAVLARLGPDVVRALDPEDAGEVGPALFARAVTAVESLGAELADPARPDPVHLALTRTALTRTDQPGGARP